MVTYSYSQLVDKNNMQTVKKAKMINICKIGNVRLFDITKESVLVKILVFQIMLDIGIQFSSRKLEGSLLEQGRDNL